MYVLFYLLGYLAIVGFICLACVRIYTYCKASPLHIRWELYPVPHEGPTRASYGGSYMEELNWWTKPRHVDHWADIKAIFVEVLALHSTWEHNPKLWVRTYPFHFGMYMLMGGTIILVCCVFLQVCGVSPQSGFMIFIGNVINAVVLVGAFCIAGGGIALFCYRLTDQSGVKAYTGLEQYLNLLSFIVFAILTLCAWTFNPSYYEVARNYIYNLFTANYVPLNSTWFVLNMLAGYCVLIFIPITNMRHLIMKYFMYHDIRWGDKPTCSSVKNQNLIDEMLQFKENWAAPHMVKKDGEGAQTWVEVATTDPAQTKE